MPGQGRAEERDYITVEREKMDDAIDVLGDATIDVHLNDNAPLEQCPRRRMELQVGWLPSPEEVAILPRKQGPGP